MFAKKITFALILIFAPTLAFAYIDPGIIGALFQGMYVVIFGFVTAWVLKPWQYIKSWLQGNKQPEEEQPISSSDINNAQKPASDTDLK